MTFVPQLFHRFVESDKIADAWNSKNIFEEFLVSHIVQPSLRHNHEHRLSHNHELQLLLNVFQVFTLKSFFLFLSSSSSSQPIVVSYYCIIVVPLLLPMFVFVSIIKIRFEISHSICNSRMDGKKKFVIVIDDQTYVSGSLQVSWPQLTEIHLLTYVL